MPPISRRKVGRVCVLALDTGLEPQWDSAVSIAMCLESALPDKPSYRSTSKYAVLFAGANTTAGRWRGWVLCRVTDTRTPCGSCFNSLSAPPTGTEATPNRSRRHWAGTSQGARAVSRDTPIGVWEAQR